MLFFYTLLLGLSKRGPVTNTSLVVQERGILRKGRYRIKFEQRPSEVGSLNLLLVFENFELHCLCVRKGCSEKTAKT